MAWYSKVLLIAASVCVWSCNGGQTQTTLHDNSGNPANGDLPAAYGCKPIYGIQDNYFDITVGEGFSLALKIIDASTDRCIRYVFVGEGSTATTTQIPQGTYYLKLAYGNDWTEEVVDGQVRGRFASDAFYERSVEAFDFGKKNSTGNVSYALRITVSDCEGLNNFATTLISEDEFMYD